MAEINKNERNKINRHLRINSDISNNTYQYYNNQMQNQYPYQYNQYPPQYYQQNIPPPPLYGSTAPPIHQYQGYYSPIQTPQPHYENYNSPQRSPLSHPNINRYNQNDQDITETNVIRGTFNYDTIDENENEDKDIRETLCIHIRKKTKPYKIEDTIIESDYIGSEDKILEFVTEEIKEEINRDRIKNIPNYFFDILFGINENKEKLNV